MGRAEHSAVFGSFISSAWGPIIFHTVFLLINAFVIVFGVRGGIERFTKLTTPVLFVLIVLIMLYSVNLPDASEGIDYLIHPDFSKLTGSALLSAMGQAFFSLSLGSGQDGPAPLPLPLPFPVLRGRRPALLPVVPAQRPDTFLGVPFNIASYALLTMMIAQVCGLQPGEFVHTTGDTHIYLNHFEQVDLQLSREPRPLPRMVINPEVKSIFDFDYGDFTLEGYDPWPAIKAPVAV